MEVIYFTTVLILILILFISTRTIFNPIIIYLVLWLFIVSLHQLYLIKYDELLNTTWYILIFTSILIVLGYIIVHILIGNNNTSSYFDHSKKLVSIKLLLILFGSLLVVRMLTVWFGIFLKFGSFSAAFTHGDIIYNLSRSGQWGPGIGFYMPVDMFSMFFAAIYHKLKGGINRIIIFIVVSNVLLHIALQSRFALLMTFALYFFTYLGANRCKIDFKIKTVIKYIILAIVFILVVSSSRGLDVHNNMSGEWGEYGLTVLPSIYFYLTNGIAGLNEYIRLGIDEYDRLYSLEPLLRFYSIFDSSIEVKIYETVTYYTPVPTIIATWIRFLIDDFGYLFMYILLFFIGGIIRYTEYKLKKGLYITWLSIYTHIGLTFILSFFGYTFFIASFWYSFSFTLFIGLLIDSGVTYRILSRYFKKGHEK